MQAGVPSVGSPRFLTMHTHFCTKPLNSDFDRVTVSPGPDQCLPGLYFQGARKHCSVVNMLTQVMA